MFTNCRHLVDCLFHNPHSSYSQSVRHRTALVFIDSLVLERGIFSVCLCVLLVRTGVFAHLSQVYIELFMHICVLHSDLVAWPFKFWPCWASVWPLFKLLHLWHITVPRPTQVICNLKESVLVNSKHRSGWVLINIMTSHRCQCFLSWWNVIQSRSPPKNLQSLWNVNWCVRVSPICILLLDFQWRCKKKKKQGECWKHYILSYLEIDYYCDYCYLYNFCKSPFKSGVWNPRHPVQRLQYETHRTGVKLVLGWIFGGYSLGSSCDFTEVLPVWAAGGRSVHLQSLVLNHWDWFRDHH